MSYHVTEKRTLTCMECLVTAHVTVVVVMEFDRRIGEVFPRHECGSTSWLDLPDVEDIPVQERYAVMRPALLERGEVVETPYGDMTREQFHEHARLLNGYWGRLGEEMRGFDL